MKITNNSKALQGIHTADGGVAYLAPGETRELSVFKRDKKAIDDAPFLTAEGDYAPNPDEPPQPPETSKVEPEAILAAIASLREDVFSRVDALNGVVENLGARLIASQETSENGSAPNTGAPATSVYAVVGKAGGWNVVTKDGVPVTKSLRDEAVKDFDAKSEDDKASFVEANKPD
ncbi:MULTISPECIES: hypothetical protein [unclassified Aureimonas]|uniref:hypothetical protein n=1 Tax=unclassified Aureimonas TaxID=2615206 RepID=UPI0006F71C53|nr:MULTISPECIES: hypothetical protein [unclassified Aureimonas]KQT52213.1 hypothetical protein ASG62_16275 [Aureimonas sp. Leaf427]KQT70553.1 hypothetical protein ASG54_21675 [Aureimonas sp. Leaf460]